MNSQIPLYKSDGQLVEWISPSQAGRLERLHLVQVVRHRKGHVSRCILRQRPGDARPTRPTDYVGTRYCYREHLDSGHEVWTLRRLGRGTELRPIFLQVLTDCLAVAK